MQEANEKEMTFWDHLDELRKVFFRIAIAVILLACIAFLNKELLFDIVLAPQQSDFILYRFFNRLAADFSMPSLQVEDFHVELINIQLTSQFMIHMSTAFYAGLLLASPYIIYLLFGFISPALHEAERKTCLKIMIPGFFLFITGILLNYFVIFPLSFRFLATYQVSELVYCIVDKLLKENPGIAYFKWDCNSPITNIYSSYLKDAQGRLYIDHVRGVYNVMKRVKENYPDVPMMLCSGGGARCDYEALKYFTEFWCSDNTDPVERAYIQWGFSQFFPAKAMCAHVTSWNKNTSIKFRTDMASMCKLGFDIGLKEMAAEELEYCQLAVANWKRLQPVILDGVQYRLVSPYESNHMAVNYVNQDASKGVVFAYDIYPRFQEKLFPLKVKGLDPNKMYRVKEINLMPGTESTLEADGELFSGDYLMKVGLDVFGFRPTQSRVIELTAE